MALGKTMKTEKEVIVTLGEELLGAVGKGRNVIGVIVKGRLDLDLHFRRQFRRHFFNPKHGGLEARHGVMWKERDEQKIVHSFGGKRAHRIRDRWVLVAHR